MHVQARFERFAFLPGLSVAHPAIVWDGPSQLYWMVSNMNRDGLRAWDADARAAPCALAVAFALPQCAAFFYGIRLPVQADVPCMCRIIHEALNAMRTARVCAACSKSRVTPADQEFRTAVYRNVARLDVSPKSACEADRSTLALHYSPDLDVWVPAGFVEFTLTFHRHFTYPSMIVSGDDLLVVTRAAIGGGGVHPCVPSQWATSSC